MKPLCWVAVLSAVLVARPSAAYTVGTGFSDACHEKIAISSYPQYLAALPIESIPPLRGEAADKLSAYFQRLFGVSADDRRHRNLLMSLVIGVQAPDTHGHSLLELENTRNIHAAPDDQYSHALRKPNDDGPEGDLAAISGTRVHIKDLVEKFRIEMQKPREQQFLSYDYYLDYYGMVTVDVWSPAFYLGEALHALQDSFSHSIRSDDFRRIRHVLNYVDGISHDHDESRDGLRHSASMDLCAGDTLPLVNAAREASIDFLLTMTAAPGEVDAVLDRWLTHESGCTFDNGYCGSPWVAVARREPTEPYLGCEQASGGAPAPEVLAVVVLLVLRRRRRNLSS
ncbi:hypothetical protein AKJ09_02050 [Labilithrix luteola]|uniref:Uncharacterized protein n=1 Tax=Labilithrix luteola TaxID=1391654 RepID=A0A0K1PPS9_9BACT|nr:MYXO-CTERM sorting domain-containing protein [Labilithrix luteola]AKU95386.1 hypothetical protein AKJ09_02050 [Labilithrix luteola]